jgi:hypothetical protein
MSCIVTLCPTNPALFAYDNKCISVCPNTTYQHPTLRECVGSCVSPYNEDDSTRRCVLICPTNPNLFAYNNRCIPQCPDTWYSDNSTRVCTQTCNSTVGYLAYRPTRMCVLVCINNTYAHNGVCVTACPNTTAPFYYIDPTTVSCVTNCPDYYLKDNMQG